MATRITNLGIDHSANIAQDVLDTPEAATREHCHFNLLRVGCLARG
jgi:hypothetical protein